MSGAAPRRKGDPLVALQGASCGADHRRDAAMNDMLSEAVAYVRPHMERGTVSDKLRTLWAGVAAARDLGAGDVVEDEFLTLARNTGLAADLGSHADAGLRHVIRWAMLGQNPFQ